MSDEREDVTEDAAVTDAVVASDAPEVEATEPAEPPIADLHVESPAVRGRVHPAGNARQRPGRWR